MPIITKLSILSIRKGSKEGEQEVCVTKNKRSKNFNYRFVSHITFHGIGHCLEAQIATVLERKKTNIAVIKINKF